MDEYESLAEMARESGFTHSAPLDLRTLDFMQDVRDMCNPKQCNNYGKSWSCPPACATLDEMRERVLGYGGGVLVQTVGDIEDSYDWDGISEAGARHKVNFGVMWDAMEKLHPSVFAMGAGVCKLCEACTYPDEPCRRPERMSASMEACGLFVSKVCKDNGLAYNYGPNKIAYTSCFLY